MRRAIIDNVKNSLGWKSSRKLVLFAVDDYGNVRRRSKRVELPPKGCDRFDVFDTLETREDLEALVDTLTAVKDKVGNSAVFTAYALACNPDFDAIEESGFEHYHSENLPRTFEKLSADQPNAYQGTWSLWKKCMEENLLSAQFHGREHFNLNLISAKLRNRDEDLLNSLRQRSLVALDDSAYKQKGWTASFSFWQKDELNQHQQTLAKGIDAFESVFGYRATAFTPPARQFHPALYPVIQKAGIKAIDRPFIYKQHEGLGKYTWKWERTRMDQKVNLIKLVRNVVFEPTVDNVDQVGRAMEQIETAFRWKKPAIISSHRVNFCGHIDPKNRAKGLASLRKLLHGITSRWPDVEFIGIGKLVELIDKDKDSSS